MPESKKRVAILGAGIGGLTTAYVLSKYGYRCRILEATARAGGRRFAGVGADGTAAFNRPPPPAPPADPTPCCSP